MEKNNFSVIGTTTLNGPKRIGELLVEFLHSEEPLAMAIRQAVHDGRMPETGQAMNLADPVEPTSLEDWITPEIVMDMLDISPRTLQTLRTNGTLPFSRIGSKLYYKRSDIERILDDAYTMRRLKNPNGYGAERV